MNAAEVIASCQGEGGLPFLVAGGFAVIAHGHSRTTFDLDMAVRRSDREAWVATFMSRGYHIFHEQSAFIQFNPTPGGINVDLILLGEETFNGLWQHGVTIRFGETTARMVSCDHLIAMKLHVLKHGPPGRYMRDLDDIISLVRNHSLNIASEPYRSMFIKYGGGDLYERILNQIR